MKNQEREDENIVVKITKKDEEETEKALEEFEKIAELLIKGNYEPLSEDDFRERYDYAYGM